MCGDGIRQEVLVWMLGGLIVISVSFYQRGVCLYNDSFQYLSTADNMVKGNGISTSLIHFDEHYYSGKLPAPQTVFPLGYPSAIALLVLLGVPLESAGVGVSAASAILLIPVFLRGGDLLNIRRRVLRCLSLVLVVNSAFSLYASSVLSDSLFTFLFLLSLSLLMRAEVAEGECDGDVYLFLGGMALGLGCWVRYAGLFPATAMFLYFGLKFLNRRDWRAFKSLVLVGSCIPFVLINFARNLALSGDLWGSNTKHMSNSLTYMSKSLIYSIGQLVLGYQSPIKTFPGIIAFVLLAVLALAASTVVYYVTRSRTGIICYLGRPPVLLVEVYIAFYFCALIYAGKTTAMSFEDPRMLYPILPVALWLVGAVFSNLSERASAVTPHQFGVASSGFGSDLLRPSANQQHGNTPPLFRVFPPDPPRNLRTD